MSIHQHGCLYAPRRPARHFTASDWRSDAVGKHRVPRAVSQSLRHPEK